MMRAPRQTRPLASLGPMLVLFACGPAPDGEADGVCEDPAHALRYSGDSDYELLYNEVLDRERADLERLIVRYARGDIPIYRGTGSLSRGEFETTTQEIVAVSRADYAWGTGLSFAPIEGLSPEVTLIEFEDDGRIEIGYFNDYRFVDYGPCDGSMSITGGEAIVEASCESLRLVGPEDWRFELTLPAVDRAGLTFELLQRAARALKATALDRDRHDRDGYFELTQDGEQGATIRSYGEAGSCRARGDARLVWIVDLDCLEASAASEFVLTNAEVCCCDPGLEGECTNTDFSVGCTPLAPPA